MEISGNLCCLAFLGYHSIWMVGRPAGFGLGVLGHGIGVWTLLQCFFGERVAGVCFVAGLGAG
jgi:hypothetical protein